MSERDEEEKSRGFKVEDRRRFSSEGELKPEHQGSDDVRLKPEHRESDDAPSQPPPGSAASQERPSGQAVAGGGPREGAPNWEGPPSEMNFSAFVVSLSTQALMHLGEIADPLTNQPQRDLRAAQHLIDILGILADKTRGNLDHDEEGLLRSILFDLRMKYVETARQHSS